jgi:hypothetical protein
MKGRKMADKEHPLHPHFEKMRPKRESFPTQEEYEEALAFFKHRLKGLRRPLKASQPA